MTNQEYPFSPEHGIFQKIRNLIGTEEVLYQVPLIDMIERELVITLRKPYNHKITFKHQVKSSIKSSKQKLRNSYFNFLGRIKNNNRFNQNITSFKASYIFCATMENHLKIFLPIIDSLIKDQPNNKIILLVPSKYQSWLSQPKIKQRNIEIFSLPDKRDLEITKEQKKTVKRFIKKILQTLKSNKQVLDRDEEFRQKIIFDINQNLESILIYRIGLANYFYYAFKNEKPKALISGRPKQDIPLSMLFAAKQLGVPTIFLSHCLWFKRHARYLQALYDLRLFDHICIFSKQCLNCIRAYNKTSQIHIIGWLQQETPNIEKANFSQSSSSICALYFLQDEYSHLSDIARICYEVGIKLILKGHPLRSQKDRESIDNIIPLEYKNNTTFYDHTEVSLQEALMKSNFVIGNLSNASIEAIVNGRPIIGYLSSNEKELFKYRPHTITSVDVPGFMSWSIEELKQNLKKIKQGQINLSELYTIQNQFINYQFNNKIGNKSIEAVKSILEREL